MISTIKKTGSTTRLSLNVIVGDVTDGVLIYEPITGLLAFDAMSSFAKDKIRKKIEQSVLEDEEMFLKPFKKSVLHDDIWLYTTTVEEAIKDSNIDFEKFDVSSVNLSVCKPGDITQENPASLSSQETQTI